MVTARQEGSERFNTNATANITEKLGYLSTLTQKYLSEFDKRDSSFNNLIERNDSVLSQLTIALYRVQSCL